MRALRALRATGELSDMSIGELPKPVPGAGEVLIEVSAVSASHLDRRLVAGLLPQGSLPRTLGTDPAGVIVAVGPDVEGTLVGTHVAVRPNLACGTCTACAARNEADCTSPRMLGVNVDGGAADFVVVPARAAFAVPDGVSLSSASAAIHTVPVALHMLRAVTSSDDDLRGKRVLVVGAAGAVGSACVQLVLARGGTPIAVVRGAEGTKAVRGLGVEAVVDTLETELAQEMPAIAPGGVDIVVETTGDSELASIGVDLLARDGRFVTCIGSPGRRMQVDQQALYLHRRSLHGAAGSDDRDVADAFAYLAEDTVDPLIGVVVPFARYADGYAALQDPIRIGKVVLEIGTRE